MIIFKNEPTLGQTVDRMTAMCFGFEPIQNLFDLRLYAGGHKFSRLCAFKFHSAMKNHHCPNFSICFVPKMRSKKFHNKENQTQVYAANPSQWYIFKHVSVTQVDVLGKKELFGNYGFDIDKFFESDVFKKMVAKFKQLIKKGLDVEIPAFLEKLKSGQIERTPNDEHEVLTFASTIKDSLSEIDKPNVNDKYYSMFIGSMREDEDSELDEKIGKAMNDIYGEEDEIMEEQKKPEDFKCKVEKVKEDGKDAWSVIEIKTNDWVATFEDEEMAKKFAEDEYPKMKADYINKQASAAASANEDDEID